METKTKKKTKFRFFWGTKDPESNFHQPVSFSDGEREFNSSEQYFMYKKALHFGDTVTAEKIMVATDPGKQKALGREITPFDSEDWTKACRRHMYEAVYLKFSQDESLKSHLISNKGKEHVEASPYDDIWGIKMRENDFRASDKAQWKGKNWLGIILDEVMDELIAGLPMSETRYKDE